MIIDAHDVSQHFDFSGYFEDVTNFCVFTVLECVVSINLLKTIFVVLARSVTKLEEVLAPVIPSPSVSTDHFIPGNIYIQFLASTCAT